MWPFRLAAILGVLLSSASSGCLALGGKIELDDPETLSRVESLEARVSALEQANGGRR